VLWKTVLAGMLDPIVIIDDLGSIHFANESCSTVFGYAPDELAGCNIKMLMPEPYRSEHDGYLAHYRATGETNILGRTRAFPVVCKDDRRIEVELSVSRIEVADGKKPLYCGSFRDVTSRKRAEEALAHSERRFRAIFDQEYQFVGLLDPEGALLEANRASLHAVGVERSDVVGKPFWDTPWWDHSVEEQERLKQAVRDAATGRFVRFETMFRTKGGPTRTIDFSLKPFRDEEGRVVLLLPEGRDITSVKRAQEREVAMMRAFAEIGEAASVLAHEIKNPITSVNLALRAVAGHLGEEDAVILDELVGRMEHLEKLMRRTLSLARPLDLEPSECDLGELVHSAVAAVAPELEERSIDVVFDVDESLPKFLLDQGLLEEVLTNLLQNAADAVPEGSGRIRVGAGRSGCVVTLFVDDNGPGIPSHVAETLFKPFVTTKASGTGLGLAIARKVVDAHGGAIHATTAPGGGTRFAVELPSAP